MNILKSQINGYESYCQDSVGIPGYPHSLASFILWFPAPSSHSLSKSDYSKSCLLRDLLRMWLTTQVVLSHWCSERFGALFWLKTWVNIWPNASGACTLPLKCLTLTPIQCLPWERADGRGWDSWGLPPAWEAWMLALDFSHAQLQACFEAQASDENSTVPPH